MYSFPEQQWVGGDFLNWPEDCTTQWNKSLSHVYVAMFNFAEKPSLPNLTDLRRYVFECRLFQSFLLRLKLEMNKQKFARNTLLLLFRMTRKNQRNKICYNFILPLIFDWCHCKVSYVTCSAFLMCKQYYARLLQQSTWISPTFCCIRLYFLIVEVLKY